MKDRAGEGGQAGMGRNRRDTECAGGSTPGPRRQAQKPRSTRLSALPLVNRPVWTEAGSAAQTAGSTAGAAGKVERMGGGWRGAKSEGTQQHQREAPCAHGEEAASDPRGSPGRPAPLPPSPVSAPWRRAYQPTPVSLPGESHGQRSWQATVHGVAKVGNNLAIKPSPPVSAPALLFPSHTPLMQRRPSALRIGSQCHLPSLTKL